MQSSNLDVIEEAQHKAPVKTVITKKRPITGSVRVQPLPPVIMKDLLVKEDQAAEQKPKQTKEEIEAHLKYLEGLSQPKKLFVPKKVIEEPPAAPL